MTRKLGERPESSERFRDGVQILDGHGTICQSDTHLQGCRTDLAWPGRRRGSAAERSRPAPARPSLRTSIPTTIYRATVYRATVYRARFTVIGPRFIPVGEIEMIVRPLETELETNAQRTYRCPMVARDASPFLFNVASPGSPRIISSINSMRQVMTSFGIWATAELGNPLTQYSEEKSL